MNNILEVKLRFHRESRKGSGGAKNLSKGHTVSATKVDDLINGLRAVVSYYKSNPKFVEGIFVDACYNDIVPKSNRIAELLKPNGKKTNDVIVGARFSDAPDGQENHIITYYVDEETVNRTIAKLEDVKRFLNKELGGTAESKNFNEADGISYEEFQSKNYIRQLVVDCSVLDAFAVPNVTAGEQRESVLITFYQAEKSVSDILNMLKIDDMYYRYMFYGKDTIAAPWEMYLFLEDRIPYMISMISSDISRMKPDDIRESAQEERLSIPAPTIEPTIGVIDNFFDNRVYFSEWVENHDYLDDYEVKPGDKTDRTHGTCVTSIVVDGPTLNPWLDDGCGRFKVRHFGVCEERISISRLVNKVKEIVINNPDIHVWNLSLGTDEEISRNYISYDAAALDELQAKHNVIFVISGTNDNREDKTGRIKIGSPADSLNAVVVNSVKQDGKPASYSRRGTVLSFFNKPDVSYYGGDYEEDERIFAYDAGGKTLVYGTSFAAPWIARKMCYLIDVLGLTREAAKALMIDAAAGWTYKQSGYKNKDLTGYGVVPIHINDVIAVGNEEIRIVMTGSSDAYKMSNYQIPVPKDTENKYPYIARATLCYFPECIRSQGVDYTTRELSLKFGRLNDKGDIKDINDNVQDEPGHYTDERQSRREFRKWENTKFISKVLKKNQAYKAYGDRLWGVSITSNERLETTRDPINFGIVVTLREVNGVNRIRDFIAACTLRGWIVNEISAENRLEVYQKVQQEIVFDDDVELEDE